MQTNPFRSALAHTQQGFLQALLARQLLQWAPHLAGFGTRAGPYFSLLRSLLAAQPGGAPDVGLQQQPQPGLAQQPSRQALHFTRWLQQACGAAAVAAGCAAACKQNVDQQQHLQPGLALQLCRQAFALVIRLQGACAMTLRCLRPSALGAGLGNERSAEESSASLS